MSPLSRRSLLARAGALAAALAWPVRRLLADEGARGLVLHEWGVLVTSGGELAGSGADAESDLPDFVHRRRGDHVRFMQAYQTALETPVAIRKPVVHVYGPTGARVRFRARFAEGRPLVWWPAADWDDASVAWELELAEEAPSPPREVSGAHWFVRLRVPEAMWCRVGDQVERFLYYDGEARWTSPLVVRRDERGPLRVENAGDEAAEDVYLVERGGRVAYRPRLAPGESWTDPEPLEVDPSTHLASRLVAAGLTGAESATIAGIWKEEFFGSGRLVLVHRLADGVYDRLLPAEVDPRPDSFVRVGLALVADQDPDLAGVVRALIDDLGADDFAARTRAEAELAGIGRPAVPALRRAEDEARDAHVRHRARILRLAIEARAGGDAIPADLEEVYAEWKRSGRVDPWRVQRGG